MNRRVLVVCKIEAVLSEFLQENGFYLVEKQSIEREQLLLEAKEYEGIITSTKIKFDQELLAVCRQLKWIARMGSGMEQIDLEFAKSKGIQCFSSPDGNANAVAEQALGMYLALRHNIVKSFLELKNGIWQREENRGFEIEGQVAGIIGLGNNGYKFAEKLAVLDLKVLAYDIEPKQIHHANIIQVDSIQEIYDHAQLISFHVPYNANTHHYFNASFLEKMQQPFTLLNLSRGKIADQKVVLAGLERGEILGAALDVWDQEPLFKMDNEMLVTAQQLLNHDRFIGTSHIGGYTFDALYKMSLSLKLKLEHII